MNIDNIELSNRDTSGLYKSQIKALEQLQVWWNSSELEATLEGFAGTGKTYLIQYFIENVVNKSFTITAPTHKALRVLEKYVGMKGLTLQSLHGLKPNTELAGYDIDNLKFDAIGLPKMGNYSLVIIDESSMISKGLFALNRQRMKDYNVKVLYIGDPYQLPPVKEDQSEVFKSVKTIIKLDTIIRQEEGNPMLKLFELLRNDIDTGGATCLNYITKYPKNIKDGVGYSMVKIPEYKDLLDEYFGNETFFNNIDYVRATGYTNAMVGSWNRHIRNTILDTENKVLIIDDLLTSYKTLVDDNNAPIIINSEDYIIDQIRTYRNEYKLDVNCIVLKSADTQKNTEMLQVLDHSNPDNIEHYINILSKLREKAMASTQKGKWYGYYKFKNQILSMIDVEVANKSLSREIDYGYTLTVHKLQGSTFDNIFVDGRDICLPITKYGTTRKTEPNLRNRLLYVALSRAKNIAYIRF